MRTGGMQYGGRAAEPLGSNPHGEPGLREHGDVGGMMNDKGEYHETRDALQIVALICVIYGVGVLSGIFILWMTV